MPKRLKSKAPRLLTRSIGLAACRTTSSRRVPRLCRQTIGLPSLPKEWDGLTIAQISDVHAGPYMPESRMQGIAELVDKLSPDMIVFTGDQLDRRPTDGALFARGFRGLSARLGVFGILGNHDHYVEPELAEWALREAGITPLVNASVVLERGRSKLAVIGVEDLFAENGRAADFSLLTREPLAFKICLCHQPQGWLPALEAGAHLTLSGHTHGGQITFPSRNLNVARLHTRYIAGPYRRHDSYLYVSRGVGVGAIPVRVGSPPEIDLLTLTRFEKANRAAA